MIMNIEHIVFLVFACFSAAIFGFAFSKLLIGFKNKAKISSLIKTHSGVSSIQANVDFVVDGFYEKILIDMVKLSYLYENSKSKLIMSRILKNKSLSQKMQNLANKSNMHKSFNNYVFRESQFKYILIFGSVFLIVGFVFSVELMMILFFVGGIFG